jgi:hypothetical protein
MLEPLSSEYLTALSSCPLDEINQLLCSSTELNQQLQKQAVEAGEKPYDYDYYYNDYNDDDNGLSEDQTPQEQPPQPPREDIDAHASSHLVARITSSQAIAYLNMIVSRSPSFQFTNNNASNATAVLPASSSHPPPPPPPLPPVQLLTNIRNVATILAHSQQRYNISSSGILVQLQTCLLLNGFNPILYIHFLECCLLAGQYHYARKYMDLHTHECGSLSSSLSLSSSPSSLSKSSSGTIYPHIVGSIPGGEKSEYSTTVIFARYHYLRGMVLYACEELSSAIVEWSHCLTMPYNNSGMIVKSGGGGGGGKSGRNVNNGVNEIVCAAWKKWVLAKCLLLCQCGDGDDDDECDNNKGGGDDEMVSRGGKEEQEKQREEEEDGGGEEGVIVRGGNAGGVVEQKRVKEVMEEEEEEEVERMATAVISSKRKNRYVTNGRVKKSILTLPRGTSTVVSRLLSQGKRRQQGKGSTAATGPGGTSTAALNDCLEQEVERYQWLVDEFLNGDLEKLLHPKRQNDNDKKSTMLQSLERDGNVGMIKQLLSVVRWRTLRKISKIYSTITISQLSRMLDMEPMECMEFLLQVALKQQQPPQPQKDLLLQKREYRTPIEFRVDGGEMGVVYFEEQDVEEEEIVYLEEKLRKTMALANRIKDLDVSLASSSRYQMNLWKHVEEGKRGGKVRGGESGRSVIDLS